MIWKKTEKTKKKNRSLRKKKQMYFRSPDIISQLLRYFGRWYYRSKFRYNIVPFPKSIKWTIHIVHDDTKKYRIYLRARILKVSLVSTCTVLHDTKVSLGFDMYRFAWYKVSCVSIHVVSDDTKSIIYINRRDTKSIDLVDTYLFAWYKSIVGFYTYRSRGDTKSIERFDTYLLPKKYRK